MADRKKKEGRQIYKYLIKNKTQALRQLKFSGNMYFSYTERLSSAKVEKVLLLQRNNKNYQLKV